MFWESDPNDVFRHRNLVRMGKTVTLPAPAGEARQARWRRPDGTVRAFPMPQTHRFAKRGRVVAVVSWGTLAAAVALVFLIIGRGGVAPVSAETILTDLKSALSKSMTIRLDDIDLGSVAIDGEILIDRSPEGPANDTMYAEIHVLLKADNRSWPDIDGVLVICQTPEAAWHFCRGNGGSGGGLFAPRRVTPTEYFVRGDSWQDFVHAPLRQFGAMPLSLSFFSLGGSVTYTFEQPQRDFVELLLRLLLDLTAVETAEELTEAWELNADSLEVQRPDETTLVLRMSGIGPNFLRRVDGENAQDLQQKMGLDESVRKLMRGISLLVFYDIEAGAVSRAELHNVGSSDGTIVLDMTRPQFDAQRLDPDHWITSRTKMFESN